MIMYELCMISEKTEILKPNGFKDFKWWSIRDLKKSPPIFLRYFPERYLIEKPLISRVLCLDDIFQKCSRLINLYTAPTFCIDLTSVRGRI